MQATLQQIFSRYYGGYAKDKALALRELRAADSIIACRTPKLGGRVLACEQDQFQRVQYHSCHHRSCPGCSQAAKQRWVEQELKRLLPCEHVHAVFTLPHAFLALWEFNRVWFTQALFDCVRESVLALCAEERFMGAKPGILMALHTWGRDLSRHPHIHTLISAGGLDAQGQWREARKNYLVPVKALSALLRGKLLAKIREALTKQRLELPASKPQAYWNAQIRSQYRKHWNVHLGERYSTGRGVALYLARYVKGGPVGKKRKLKLTPGDSGEPSIGFDYLDHRDSKTKRARLAVRQFIGRVLWHANPKGQHAVRHCGLYASAVLRHHAMSMKHLSPFKAPRTPQPYIAPVAVCPRCDEPLKPVLSLLKSHRFGEISEQVMGTERLELCPTSYRRGQTSARAIGDPIGAFFGRCSPLN